MLRKATREDINAYKEEIWKMAQKPECCCYPIYYDGIKTRDELFILLTENIQNENEELFVYEENRMFHGIIGYFEKREDKYIQLNICMIQHGMRNAMQELWQKLNDMVEDGTIYLGFPAENKEAIAHMEENHFEKVEESWNHCFLFSEYQERKILKKVRKVINKNDEDFLQIYQVDDYTYWNIDRIKRTFDRWNIYIAYEGNQPVSALILQKDEEHEEIFGISNTKRMTVEHYEAMMNIALKESKERGVKSLTYFSEEHEKGCLEKLGFHCIGKYVLYIKNVKTTKTGKF